MKFIILITLITCSFSQSNLIDSLEVVIKTNSDIQTKYRLARLYHDAVVDEENDDYTERAEELFEEVLKEKRDHVEAMAIYGSLKTIMARDAFMPWNKMKYVEQGCDLMDKALQLEPDNLTLRMTRALNNIQLPDFFNRITYCLEDFKYIINHPSFNHFSNATKLEVHFYYGRAFENNDQFENARAMYKDAVALNMSSGLASKAKESLSDLSE